MSPSVLIAVLIPLMSAAPATTHCTFPFNGSNGANAPETAPTKQDFASSTPSISPPLESTYENPLTPAPTTAPTIHGIGNSPA